ncbi:MAG: pyridoxal-5-phosphate-dependent protein subunit beta, partial [Candidatus Heimdallarchaeota archaeon]
MIDLKVNESVLKEVVKRARKQNIIIPTLKQQRNPEKIPSKIQDELTTLGLWDIHPRNLFRITWKNEPKEKGGGFVSTPNYIELPPSLTG